MEYRGFTLDAFQAQAIAHLEAGTSVLVSAPTGTGKTVVADWVVDRALAQGRHVVYTAPIKALSNQKFRDYTRLHGEDRVGLVTGDLVIRRDAPCRVMTTEILRNMLLSGEDLSQLYAVVVDEIHFLDDRERGTVWEEILIYLPKHVLIVGLSATLSNLTTFAEWLSTVREARVAVVTETQRAVPLRFYLANVDVGLVDRDAYEKRWRRHQTQSQPAVDHRGRGGGGRGRGRDRDARRRRHVKKTRHGKIIRMLVENDLLPCLYFAFSRRDIESSARWLGRNMPGTLLTPREESDMDTRLFRAREELGDDVLQPELANLYGRGIGFHHAGLHVSLKALVEELYEAKLIKVLYCTSTFALGINMPARSVAFDSLRKYDGKAVNPLSVRGFMQKAGRAGRRGMDDVGHVVLRVDFDEYEELRPLLGDYFAGRPEPVRSSFNLSWNSIVNLLQRNDREQVREIVQKSFLAWHLDQRAEEHRSKADSLERSAEDETSESAARRARKEARRLRKRASREGGRCWDEFQDKERFLKRHGYLRSDGSFNAGATVLCNLQIAEIFMTEIVLAGVLEELDDPTLYGVLCGIVGNFPRKAQRNYGLDKDTRRLAHRIEAIRASAIVAEAEHMTDIEVVWAPEWIPLGRAWVIGEDMVDVLAMVDTETDIAGDVVGTFRRAKDLCKQLSEVLRDLPDRSEALRALVKRVSRDEVEVVD
jgi:superfamily II RNA helicase